MVKEYYEHYARVAGMMEAQGYHDEARMKEALRLNPKSILERAMEAKSGKELEKLCEEIDKAQRAFNEGYFKAMRKRKKLTKYERQDLDRLIRLKKSGMPHQQEIAEIELEAFIVKKISEGVSPDVLRKLKER